MQFSNRYIIFFAVVVCLVCSLAVSSLAVSLKEVQDANKLLDMNKNIVRVAGLVPDGEKPTKQDVDRLLEQIDVFLIDRATGERVASVDKNAAIAHDLRKAIKDPKQSVGAGDSSAARRAQVKRLPNQLKVYQVRVPGHESYILPIQGNGLWSTLYGFLCVQPDGKTVAGITYYEHGETPGLGGEVENPNWVGQWPGKQIYGPAGAVKIHTVKGGIVDAHHDIDALSGATITSNGVNAMMDLWLGPEGYQPFLLKNGRGD